jgi:hypothetical protein
MLEALNQLELRHSPSCSPLQGEGCVLGLYHAILMYVGRCEGWSAERLTFPLPNFANSSLSSFITS